MGRIFLEEEESRVGNIYEENDSNVLYLVLKEDVIIFNENTGENESYIIFKDMTKGSKDEGIEKTIFDERFKYFCTFEEWKDTITKKLMYGQFFPKKKTNPGLSEKDKITNMAVELLDLMYEFGEDLEKYLNKID